MSSTSSSSSSSSSYNESLSSGTPPSPLRKMRSLDDLYEVFNPIDDGTLYCLLTTCDTIVFEEAIKDAKWRIVTDEEIALIEKNEIWRLIPRPNEKKPIGVKWIYKEKKNAKGEVDRYKACLVAKGYSQKHGIDYEKVFALVTRLETIRLIIATVAQYRWRIYQINVKSAFLNGFPKEEIYIEQPMGYEVKGHEDKVLKLNKALYGLKQALKAWYSHIDGYFLKNGFVKCPFEYVICVKIKESSDTLILCLYVDDLIFTKNNPKMFEDFKQAMITEFEMTNIGLMSYYLGIEIKQGEDVIFVNQEKFVREILKKFKMKDYAKVNTLVECGVKMSKNEKRRR
jgi:hypothetical protein